MAEAYEMLADEEPSLSTFAGSLGRASAGELLSYTSGLEPLLWTEPSGCSAVPSVGTALDPIEFRDVHPVLLRIFLFLVNAGLVVRVFTVLCKPAGLVCDVRGAVIRDTIDVKECDFVVCGESWVC
jgi:hypothetical protein